MLWIGLLIVFLLGIGAGRFTRGKSAADAEPIIPAAGLKPSIEEIGQLLRMESEDREVRFRETYASPYEPVYELDLVDNETQKHLGGVSLTGTAVMRLRDILNAREKWTEEMPSHREKPHTARQEKTST